MAKTIFSRWDHCYHLHCSISMTRQPKNISLGDLLEVSAPFACMCLFWLEAAYFHYSLSGHVLLIVGGSWQNGVSWGKGLFHTASSSSWVYIMGTALQQGGHWREAKLEIRRWTRFGKIQIQSRLWSGNVVNQMQTSMCCWRTVTENHKEAQTGCVVFKARLGRDGAETSDGFTDNGFIVQANCLRI